MSVSTTVLWRMSAMELADAIRSGQTSSQEVIEAHLRRIEAVNPPVNAVTVVLGEQTLEAAKAADRAIAAGGDLPRFHGVPGATTARAIWEQAARICGSYQPVQPAQLFDHVANVAFFPRRRAKRVRRILRAQ
jgi:amidase